MDRVSTISLVSHTNTKDDIGQEIQTESIKTVYCTVLSVTRTEWTAAQQQSLSPAYCLKVFFADYNGETVAEFEGKRYEIYRTYGKSDYIELYLGVRVGELRGNP